MRGPACLKLVRAHDAMIENVAADTRDDPASAILDDEIAIGYAAAERLRVDAAEPDRQLGDALAGSFKIGVGNHPHPLLASKTAP